MSPARFDEEDDTSCPAPHREHAGRILDQSKGATAAGEWMFFKVVLRHPEKRKRCRTDASHSRWGTADSIGVVLHNLVLADAVNHKVTVSLKGAGGRSSSHLLNKGPHMNRVLKFDSAADIKFIGMDGVTTSAATAALEALMKMGAYNEDGFLSMPNSSDNELIKSGLAELYALKVVDFVDVADTPHWFVTEHGADTLSLALTLTNPTDAFQTRPDVVLERLTTWELLQQLRGAGWELKVWISPPASNKYAPAHPTPFDVASNKPRVAWIKSGAREMYGNYIRVLLQANVLKEQGYSQVLHLQPKEYYLQMLGKKSSRRRHTLDIRNDGGDNDDSVVAASAAKPQTSHKVERQQPPKAIGPIIRQVLSRQWETPPPVQVHRFAHGSLALGPKQKNSFGGQGPRHHMQAHVLLSSRSVGVLLTA